MNLETAIRKHSVRETQPYRSGQPLATGRRALAATRCMNSQSRRGLIKSNIDSAGHERIAFSLYQAALRGIRQTQRVMTVRRIRVRVAGL